MNLKSFTSVFGSMCALLCACVLAPVALGNSYQFEITGAAQKSKADYEQFGEDRFRAGSISAVYYFNPVEPGNGPLAEAAFLNKAGFISLKKSRGTVKREALITVTGTSGNSDYVFAGLDDQDLDAKSAAARFVFRNDMTVDVSAGKHEETIGEQSYKKDSAGFTIGTYVRQRNWFGIGYQRLSVSPLEESGKHNVHALQLSAHHVQRDKTGFTMGMDYGLQWENGREEDDALEVYATFSFYPSQKLGFDFHVSVRDEDNANKGRFNLGTEYFFIPQFAVGATFYTQQIDFKHSSVDYLEKGLQLALTGRF